MTQQSMYSIQYIQKPVDVPLFLASRSTNLQRLIQWANDEHRRWLQRCAEKGYYKYLKVLNEEYSPIRFLAEMKGFRRICANITEHEWNKLTRKERRFITSAYEMRDMLMRGEDD